MNLSVYDTVITHVGDFDVVDGADINMFENDYKYLPLLFRQNAKL